MCVNSFTHYIYLISDINKCETFPSDILSASE
jgi:hypothetical protein